jgi:hypothetical protein
METETERPLPVSFVAGSAGSWKIDQISVVAGDSLPAANQLEVIESPEEETSALARWILGGVTSNVRYTNRSEFDALKARQERLGVGNRPAPHLSPSARQMHGRR